MSTIFADLGIHQDILKRLVELKINISTDIQTKTIPSILNKNEDIIAVAKTGTGKTAAFGLPILQLIATEEKQLQALILVPTRELGQQIYDNLISFSKYKPAVSCVLACGGVPIKPQITRVAEHPQVIIATPGRLLDLVNREAVQLNTIKYLVLDEADELITALKTEVDSIIKQLPKTRRNFIFTATLSGGIKQLTNNYLSKNVLHIEADMATLGHQGIDHKYVVVDPIEKLEILFHFLNSKSGQRGVIFCKTKAAVNKLAKKLAINKFSSGALHGSLSQGIRDRIMGQFREGYIDILVATDLAARGLDVKDLAFVVNYHLPDTYEAYVHRSGRTARAGANGLSLTILQQEEVVDIDDFEAALGINFSRYTKPNTQSIEENNAMVWAKKLFKTKPNKAINEDFKSQIKTIFHHLTKEELVDKLLANYIAQNQAKDLTTKPTNKT